jgi:hypothetical protein
VNKVESLRRYGVHPADGDLNEVREMLSVRAARERRHQRDGDTELMELCCVQLFSADFLTDLLLAYCSIDVHLPCGAGLSRRSRDR